MTKYKRIGIILILIGICIPLVAFVFSSGYNPKLGFLWSITKMNIYLWTQPAKPQTPPPGLDFDPYFEPHDIPVVLPYKYTFGLGVIFVLSGIGFFVLSKPKKTEK